MEKRVALVTGASSGIGKATALALLKHGFVVYGAARRLDAMAPLLAAGGHALDLDLTNEASIEACAKSILDTEHHIDVLINNAGYEAAGAVEDIPIAGARRQFEVNLFGLARLIQLVLPGMRARRSGRIINISSMGGTIYTPLGAWYHASKHAVEGFSDCLRLELAGHGIDVVVVAPGAIDSSFNTVVADQRAQGFRFRALCAAGQGARRTARPKCRVASLCSCRHHCRSGHRAATENPLPAGSIRALFGDRPPAPRRPRLRLVDRPDDSRRGTGAGCELGGAV